MARRWLPVWVIACVGASLAAACGGSASERSTAGDGQSTALGRASEVRGDRIDLRSPDMDGRKDPVSRDTRLRLSQRRQRRGPLRSGRHRGAPRQQRATCLRRDCYACREPGVPVARSLAPAMPPHGTRERRGRRCWWRSDSLGAPAGVLARQPQHEFARGRVDRRVLPMRCRPGDRLGWPIQASRFERCLGIERRSRQPRPKRRREDRGDRDKAAAIEPLHARALKSCVAFASTC
jgi:hypothetical protein